MYLHWFSSLTPAGLKNLLKKTNLLAQYTLRLEETKNKVPQPSS